MLDFFIGSADRMGGKKESNSICMQCFKSFNGGLNPGPQFTRENPRPGEILPVPGMQVKS